MEDKSDVTRLLHAFQEGDESVVDVLFDHVYDELYNLAHQQLARLRPGQTLNTTALVHEAYLKLVNQSKSDWESRAHFFSVAAKAMRHIIINYARKQSAEKRGGDVRHVSFDERLMAPQDSAETLITVDRVLDQLEEKDERMARVVELQFFGGMTQKETATVLDVSTRTVRRDWRSAKAWLSKALSEGPLNGSSASSSSSV
ncbi:MAG: sigma-70 family RNA polymerase sigma factor [Salinivenus sp.]